MFAAFDGTPMILRLYGQARVAHINDPDWHALYQHFQPLPGARQIFDVAIDRVQTSCGLAVPLFNYASDRELLNDWAVKKGETGIQDYWQEKNRLSLDGKPIKMPSK